MDSFPSTILKEIPVTSARASKKQPIQRERATFHLCKLNICTTPQLKTMQEQNLAHPARCSQQPTYTSPHADNEAQSRTTAPTAQRSKCSPDIQTTHLIMVSFILLSYHDRLNGLTSAITDQEAPTWAEGAPRARSPPRRLARPGPRTLAL